MLWLWLLVMLLLSAAPALAATIYTDHQCGNITTYNPVNRACTGGSARSYTTLTAALQSGQINTTNNVWEIRGGTYNETRLNLTLPSGTSGNRITMRTGAGETVTLRNCPFRFGGGVQHFTIEGTSGQQNLVIDQGSVSGSGCFDISSQGSGVYPSNITLQNFEMFGGWQDVLLVAGDNILVRQGKLHDNIGQSCVNSHGSSSFCHGIYFDSGNNNTFEHLEIYNTTGHALKLCECDQACVDSGRSCSNHIARNNRVHHWGLGGAGGTAGIITSSGANSVQVYNNVAYSPGSAGDPASCAGLSTWRGSNTVWYNNTVSQIGANCSGLYLSPYVVAVNARNNIVVDGGPNITNALDTGRGPHTVTANLCTASGFGCSRTGNPQFVNAPAGNFHIASASSPAVNGGDTLGAPYNVDIEGNARPAGFYTIGAYQFSTEPPPAQVGNVARWTFEEGAGLTAADSEVGTGAGGHTCTLNTAGWTTGIIGAFGLNANGARWCTATATLDLQPAAEAGISAWIKPAGVPPIGEGAAVALPSDALYLDINASAVPGCWAYVNGNFQVVRGGSVPFGTQQHVSCTYKSGPGLTLRVGDVVVGTLALSGNLDYSLAPAGVRALRVGRSDLSPDSYNFNGVIDQVYIYDTEISAALNTSLFQELVPTTGFALTHMAWYAAHAPEGQRIGAIDTNLSVPLINPGGLRGSIHKGDAGSITEYFRPFCRVNTGTGFPPWTSAVEVTNGFDSLGIRYLADTVITQGQTATVLLPTDGLTGVAGKILESPIDLVAPYDGLQRMTLAQGQHAEQEIRIEFGAPLAVGHQVQCQFRRENGAVLDQEANLIILTLTEAGVSPVTSLRLGLTQQGGTLQ